MTACHLWEQVRPLLNDSPEAYLMMDDSVQAKKHARKMDLVKHQYSGNEGDWFRELGWCTDGEDYYPD